MQQVTELFAALVEWVLSTGAEKLHLLPGLWTGETGEWRVECNPSTTEERAEIPPLTFRLQHKTALIGVALVSVGGGCISGPSENDLIEHFRAETRRNEGLHHA